MMFVAHNSRFNSYNYLKRKFRTVNEGVSLCGGGVYNMPYGIQYGQQIHTDMYVVVKMYVVLNAIIFYPTKVIDFI
jgi:hypothetical protein